MSEESQPSISDNGMSAAQGEPLFDVLRKFGSEVLNSKMPEKGSANEAGYKAALCLLAEISASKPVSIVGAERKKAWTREFDKRKGRN